MKDWVLVSYNDETSLAKIFNPYHTFGYHIIFVASRYQYQYSSLTIVLWYFYDMECLVILSLAAFTGKTKEAVTFPSGYRRQQLTKNYTIYQYSVENIWVGRWWINFHI